MKSININLEKILSSYIYRILAIIFIIIFSILILSIIMSNSIFSLEGEVNISTWFSSQLLFAVSMSAIFNYILAQYLKNSSLKVFNRSWVWILISLVFLFLSMDEAAFFHERITIAARHFFRNENLRLVWMLIYVPAFISGIIFLYPFARFIYKKEPAAFISAIVGIIAWLISLSFEFVAQFFLRGTDLYAIEVMAEEGLEMLGSVCFLLSSMLIAKGIIVDGVCCKGAVNAGQAWLAKKRTI